MPKNPSSARLSTIIGTTLVIFLLDWFYLGYMTSKGFEPKTYNFAIGTFTLHVPIQWLPIAGAVLVAFVVSYEVSYTIFPRRVSLDQDALSSIRLMRAIVLSLTVFVVVLFVPYIIGSDWFWAGLSIVSNISQIRDLGQSLLNADQALMGLDQIWQYSISQSAALMCMVLSAFVFGRSPKRFRK